MRKWVLYRILEAKVDFMYKYVNYLDSYGRIMQFNKNKLEPIHRWYPFVEGYSKEFINSIISEQKGTVSLCLEPFSGSGTTALELQNLGVQCYSFEVNPFMYLLSKVKLETNYDINTAIEYFTKIKRRRCQYKKIILNDEFSTLYQNENLTKWNYDNSVGIAIEKLKKAIRKIEEPIYNDLFTIVLASILLDVSNLYRNGKCLSYKQKWNEIHLTEKDVYNIFDDRFKSIFLPDIEHALTISHISNKPYLYNEDSRIGIDQHVEDNSVDLVITSPPYLNSRDYTDTYMLELKTLGFAKNLKDITKLREKTFRSHVQIKWKDNTTIDIPKLNKLLVDLSNKAQEIEMWNSSIINMIRLYFVDIYVLFKQLSNKLKKGGKVYFNVSNSAYFNTLVDTVEITCDIAEKVGLKVVEIRKARMLKTSPQQKDYVGKLLEAVIVIEKTKEM